MKGVRSIILAAFVLLVCGAGAFGQGGWRQWDIYLRDGTKIQASPLALNNTGQLTYSMRNVPVERSTISYIAIVADNLPALPTGNFTRDLVVKIDGTRSLGAVIFRDVKFSEGKVVQNGKDIDLREVAYVKFATPKTKKSSKKS